VSVVPMVIALNWLSWPLLVVFVCIAIASQHCLCACYCHCHCHQYCLAQLLGCCKWGNLISTWVLQGMGQARGPILQCPQAADGRRKTFPWSGVHHATGARLHLAERADRKRLLILSEDRKHILCAQIEVCGAAAEWKGCRVAKSMPGRMWCIIVACLGGWLFIQSDRPNRLHSCWPWVCHNACGWVWRTFRPCKVFVSASAALCCEVGCAVLIAVALRCDAFAEMHPGF